LAASLLGLGLTLGCDSTLATATDPVGGETHFLTACDPQTQNACGDHLTCLCNVCTAACEDENGCPDVPGVACADAGAVCGSGGPAKLCDVPCASDADCAALSSARVCDQGFCRAGVSRPLESGDALSCAPRSVGAGSVLVIGDELFAGPNRVATALDTLAQSSGVLPADAQFRDASSSNLDTLAYNGNGIAAQYLLGNRNGDARLVIMTGGAVDALSGNCPMLNVECPVFLAAALDAADLLQQMAADGVQEVVYAYYPDPADSGQKARIDLLRTLIQPVCEQSLLPCYFLDLRPVFQGHESDYVAATGLTSQGSAATATAIWNLVASCLTP
jgi:hypothetical protein